MNSDLFTRIMRLNRFRNNPETQPFSYYVKQVRRKSYEQLGYIIDECSHKIDETLEEIFIQPDEYGKYDPPQMIKIDVARVPDRINTCQRRVVHAPTMGSFVVSKFDDHDPRMMPSYRLLRFSINPHARPKSLNDIDSGIGLERIIPDSVSAEDYNVAARWRQALARVQALSADLDLG